MPPSASRFSSLPIGYSVQISNSNYAASAAASLLELLEFLGSEIGGSVWREIGGSGDVLAVSCLQDQTSILVISTTRDSALKEGA